MIKKQHALTTAVFLCAIAPLPAMAAMENLGTIDVSATADRDVVYSTFGGSVESIQLRASESNINCRAVTAKFGNGRSRRIFSGRLMEGRATNVDLPGNERNISSLTFNCRSDERWGGRVRVLADVGRYQNEWRRNPDWSTRFSQLFNWANTTTARNDTNDRGNGRSGRGNSGGRGNGPDNWVQIGTESFEGNRDQETTSAGWAGRNIESIALMPVEANARCSRVTANFRQGPDQNLAISNSTTLRRGQYSKVDLPGNRRDLTSLKLNCRAEGARNVTIRIFTTK